MSLLADVYREEAQKLLGSAAHQVDEITAALVTAHLAGQATVARELWRYAEIVHRLQSDPMATERERQGAGLIEEGVAHSLRIALEEFSRTLGVPS